MARSWQQLGLNSELGVVLLLFLIGLEIQLPKLWAMRRQLLGLGGSQILISALCIGAIALSLGLLPVAAGVVEFALSLSSTAFAI